MNGSVGRRRQERVGRIVAVANSTNGTFDLDKTFTQTFALTDLGKLDHQTYPSLAGVAPDRTVYSTYTNGFLTSVGPNYATAITYWPNGLMNTVTHANGVTDSQALDPNAMARPQAISTSGAKINGGPGGDWATGAYGYDGAGNIAAMTRSPSDKDTFTYDLVSRLNTASVTASDGQHTQSVTFDSFGNINSFTNDGAVPTPAPTTTAATNHLQAGTYDGAGNLTGWNSASYGWDGFNQLQTVQGTGIARYNAYSPEGERVLMRDQNTTTITLRGLDNKVLRDITYDPTAAAGQQWRWAKDYVYRDGSLLASVSATDGIRHYTLDHLGSPRLLTDRCGERKKLFTYLPFGQEVPQPSASNPEDKERMRFTVHERDLGLLDTGADDLDYMHARTYGPAMGRFLSVDPVPGQPQRPQSWNLYAYAAGNPIRYVDTNGDSVVDVINGFANAIGSDFLLGANRATPVNGDFATGQAIGDAWATYFGALEAEAGATLTIGGSGLTVGSDGLLAEAGVPVAAAGIAITVQGAGAAVAGATNLAKFAIRGDGNAGETQVNRGNLKLVSPHELTKAGLDAHELKAEAVGEKNMSKYDIYKDNSGNLYAVRKGQTKEAPVPLGERLGHATRQMEKGPVTHQ